MTHLYSNLKTYLALRRLAKTHKAARALGLHSAMTRRERERRRMIALHDDLCAKLAMPPVKWASK